MFDDRIDRLFDLVAELRLEVGRLQERVDALERLLERQGGECADCQVVCDG